MRLFLYQEEGQETGRWFGQLALGCEEVGREELEELGAEAIEAAPLGFHFRAAPAVLYRIVYCSRIFSRFLAPLARFDAASPRALYRGAIRLPWHLLLSPDDTFAINANVSGNARLRHSRYAAQLLKDAVVDYFRERTGRRPSVELHDPDLFLNLYIRGREVTVSLDLGGGALHRRGYRAGEVPAPLRETVAAAAVRFSGWKADRPLYDPFCGSGTLLFEAWMKAANLPAAFLRDRFGFTRLPDFDPESWARVRREAEAAVRPVPAGLIAGSDVSAEALRVARASRARLPGAAESIRLRRADFRELEGFSDALILTNPPHGIRLGDFGSAARLLGEFGDWLKQRCTGSSACIYYGDAGLVKKLGLKPAWKKPLSSGGLSGVLAFYELY